MRCLYGYSVNPVHFVRQVHVGNHHGVRSISIERQVLCIDAGEDPDVYLDSGASEPLYARQYCPLGYPVFVFDGSVCPNYLASS